MLSSTPRCFKPADEIADGLVHAMDHGGIHGHDVIEAILFGGRQCLPTLDRLGTRRGCPRGFDDTQLPLARDALITERVPACLVSAAKLRDLLGGRLQREVRRVVAEMQVKRLLRRAAPHQ